MLCACVTQVWGSIKEYACKLLTIVMCFSIYHWITQYKCTKFRFVVCYFSVDSLFFFSSAWKSDKTHSPEAIYPWADKKMLIRNIFRYNILGHKCIRTEQDFDDVSGPLLLKSACYASSFYLFIHSWLEKYQTVISFFVVRLPLVGTFLWKLKIIAIRALHSLKNSDGWISHIDGK